MKLNFKINDIVSHKDRSIGIISDIFIKEDFPYRVKWIVDTRKPMITVSFSSENNEDGHISKCKLLNSNIIRLLNV